MPWNFRINNKADENEHNLKQCDTLLLYNHSYIATMVDESCEVTALSCIDNVFKVYSEQIATANTLCLITALPLVRYQLSHVLAHVLHYHLISWNILKSKQTPVVNCRLSKTQLFVTSLKEECVFDYYWRERERGSYDLGYFLTFSWLYCCISLETSPDVNRLATRRWFNLLPRPLPDDFWNYINIGIVITIN